MNPRFTKARVDFLVAAKKFIKAIPLPPKESPAEFRIQAQVFKKAEPNDPEPGLIVIARVAKHLPGTVRHRPSTTLVWHGIRIRGIDYEIWHDNPNGTVVKGWHEHLWSLEEGDAYARPARPFRATLH